MNTASPLGTALVTGASSGIGAVYADRLARRGHDLILVARSRARLETLAAELRRQTGRGIAVLPADLGVEADVRKVEKVLREEASIAMLVNNAGMGAGTGVLDGDIDRMRAMIDLNVTVPTRLSYAAAPAFAVRGRGAIVNIASIVALAPTLLNGVYGASKAYVLAFTQSLQHQLADKGVRVQAVLPGAIATGFWDASGVPLQQLPPDRVMTTDDLVDAALAGYDQGELVTIPSLPDTADWRAFEAAREAMAPNLSRRRPAARYGVR